MNKIELLQDKIVQRFPSAQATIDKPMNPDGYWFLDITLGTRYVFIEWRPGQGFGVSDCSETYSHVYGQGPDKIFEEDGAAFQEVVRLLKS